MYSNARHNTPGRAYPGRRPHGVHVHLNVKPALRVVLVVGGMGKERKLNKIKTTVKSSRRGKRSTRAPSPTQHHKEWKPPETNLLDGVVARLGHKPPLGGGGKAALPDRLHPGQHVLLRVNASAPRQQKDSSLTKGSVDGKSPTTHPPTHPPTQLTIQPTDQPTPRSQPLTDTHPPDSTQ